MAQLPENLKHGKPCGTCGGTLRYKSNRSCVPCSRARDARWRKENHEYDLARKRAQFEESRLYYTASRRRVYKQNAEYYKAQARRRYYERNIE